MIKLNYISAFVILILSANLFGREESIHPQVIAFQNIEQQVNDARTKNETRQAIADFNRQLDNANDPNITQNDLVNINNQIRETYNAIEAKVRSFHPNNLQLIRSQEYRQMNQRLTNLGII